MKAFIPFVLALMAALFTGQVQAKEPIYTPLFSNVAVSGYDTVAYFTEGQPVKGSATFSHEWQGAVWHFANAENRDAFKAKPEAYAPQYGGYCAWAVSEGYTASGDPTKWRIVDGKLYLNFDAKVQATWLQDVPGNIAKADRNWPAVLER